MKVGLQGGRQASESDISALEALIGQPLDDQFRKFAQTNNGARPTENSFPVNGVAHVGGVNKFIAVEDIISERQNIEEIGPRAYPIASSEGGNYIILDQDKGGSIYFWDHEVEGGVSKIAERLDLFLNIIEPFAGASFNPAPGQVKSSWIDPDFLKQLENGD